MYGDAEVGVCKKPSIMNNAVPLGIKGADIGNHCSGAFSVDDVVLASIQHDYPKEFKIKKLEIIPFRSQESWA